MGPSKPIILAGFPSIKILTLWDPLKLTFPSISKSIEGIFSKISSAVPPLLLKSLPTLKTRLSNFNSKLLLSALIVTSLSAVASESKLIFFRSISLFSLSNGTLILFDLYPTYVISAKIPLPTFVLCLSLLIFCIIFWGFISILNFPFSSLIPPDIRIESSVKIDIVA